MLRGREGEVKCAGVRGARRIARARRRSSSRPTAPAKPASPVGDMDDGHPALTPWKRMRGSWTHRYGLSRFPRHASIRHGDPRRTDEETTMTTIAHAASSRLPTPSRSRTMPICAEMLCRAAGSQRSIPAQLRQRRGLLAKGASERPACAVVDLRLPHSGPESPEASRRAAAPFQDTVVTGHGDVSHGAHHSAYCALDFPRKSRCSPRN